jgi:hypothetical protein
LAVAIRVLVSWVAFSSLTLAAQFFTGATAKFGHGRE